MKLLRTANGLGNAIYLRAMVLHLLRKGESVTVFTKWPDVFSDLGIVVEELAAAEGRQVIHASYPTGQRVPENESFFRLCCLSAEIEEQVDLRIDWPVRNHALLKKIKEEAGDRKILFYQPRKTVVHGKEASALLRPRREAFVSVLEKHKHYYRVKLGHPPFVDEDKEMPFELDLFGKAFIFDTFDVATISDLFFGQLCFVTALAEALNKKFICILSRAALNSRDPRANTSTAQTLHKKHLATVVYDG